jgi:hypothetical protein
VYSGGIYTHRISGGALENIFAFGIFTSAGVEQIVGAGDGAGRQSEFGFLLCDLL